MIVDNAQGHITTRNVRLHDLRHTYASIALQDKVSLLSEPIRYAAAIQSAFMQRLQADEGYAGLITKNPLHPHWQTECWTKDGYSLDYLVDFVDIRNHPKTGRERADWVATATLLIMSVIGHIRQLENIGDLTMAHHGNMPY
ncbi:hypothetical protein C9J12_23570 [Photobacterium frigidiphilum]|uniref:Uncharacterized protein n=1 Tax=Photobacterium frigidiphilum TaxID=264736 RepID=A0A2T3J8Q5_9GAMM|nr:replication initiation protein [Photobacterium frigidiphilum]PSU45188.1 hypothetical protein C9J12_23570 [Photobacterium frigidiphilum]